MLIADNVIIIFHYTVQVICSNLLENMAECHIRFRLRVGGGGYNVGTDRHEGLQPSCVQRTSSPPFFARPSLVLTSALAAFGPRGARAGHPRDTARPRHRSHRPRHRRAREGRQARHGVLRSDALCHSQRPLPHAGVGPALCTGRVVYGRRRFCAVLLGTRGHRARLHHRHDRHAAHYDHCSQRPRAARRPRKRISARRSART